MKTINLKNHEILEIVKTLSSDDSLMKSTTKKIDFDILWDIDKNLKELQKIVDSFNEMKKSIDDKYSDDKHSVQDDKGRNVLPEFRNEYLSSVNQLLMADNEINICTIDVDRLKNSSEGLTPSDFSAIKFMLTKQETSDEV
jgi:hypothetical protein